ncbi:MAG: TetR/AcrR family transcriptional regulator [Eubacteriales bacterium]
MKDIKQLSKEESILWAAKEEFYENGYDHGIIRNISDRANVPQSLVTYYFKTKQNLISRIYKDFFNNIEDLIDTYSGLNITNSLYKKIVLTYIYYDIILNDNKNRRFYMEVRKKISSNYKILHEASDKIMVKYIDDFNLSMTKFEFEIFMIMESAARRDFFIYYFEKDLDLTILEIVSILETVSPKLFGIDQDIINSYLLKGNKIVKEIDYSQLRFLI